ncbi:homeobox-leucine zipper protein HOX11-like [Canna indica]|uniref:Homeobox-leucine zipper protein HOX11-like n=1 Tax=Canna indica TaxID=4628 RepID=A0AAQ3KDP3_9LILI|nr:homeobox-leucine zipper protein HOX11-like [Canna indica]
MELGLRLGTAPAGRPSWAAPVTEGGRGSGLLLTMRLGVGRHDDEVGEVREEEEDMEVREPPPPPSPPLQLNLLTLAPPELPPPSRPQFPWATENRNFDGLMRGFDVNWTPPLEAADEGTSSSSSPNSTVSSFRIEFSAQRGWGESAGGAAAAAAAEMTSSKLEDDEENGLARKKLRLSKEQSAFLEESFKQHNTLNPNQKLALAKQLNLRPRQVEVWFQNRRARTKLKHTEVQCEYLKRCCQTLTEENHRLHKEVADLKALKTCHPFSMHFPAATTLSMCTSCERVASNPAISAADRQTNSTAALFSRSRVLSSVSHIAAAAPRQPSPPTDRLELM